MEKKYILPSNCQISSSSSLLTFPFCQSMHVLNSPGSQMLPLATCPVRHRPPPTARDAAAALWRSLQTSLSDQTFSSRPWPNWCARAVSGASPSLRHMLTDRPEEDAGHIRVVPDSEAVFGDTVVKAEAWCSCGVTGKDGRVWVGTALSSEHPGLAPARRQLRTSNAVTGRGPSRAPTVRRALCCEWNSPCSVSSVRACGQGLSVSAPQSPHLSDGDEDALLSNGASEGLMSLTEIDCHFAKYLGAL